MKTIFNFGDTHKNFKNIADEVLGKHKSYQIPITSNNVFYNDKVQIVDACYGPSMTLDALSMLKIMGKIKEKDEIVFVGSMGSLTEKIKLDEIVIPTEIICNHFGYNGKILRISSKLLGRVALSLNEKKINFKFYKHGSVMAVFDPTTNHSDYTSSLYDKSVKGIDCSETYIGTNFCKENKIDCVTLLYCSDSPGKHISDLPKNEFDARALKFDRLLNKIALDSLK
jgi:purine-nucleoside phosphorylase